MLVRSRWALALLVLSATAACTHEAARQEASIGLGFVVPQALFDRIDSMKLYIVEASDEWGCDEETGATTGELASAEGVQVFDLRRGTPAAPCPDDAAYCSEPITLPTDANRALLFQAVGYHEQDTYAVGCRTAAVNSDPFHLHLVMHRHLAEAVCGNGELEPGEQCEGDGGTPSEGDPMCDTQCRSKELLLSSDNQSGSSQILNAPAQSKSRVSLAWAAAGPLHAVFQDKNGTNSEINYRQLLPDMGQVTNPPVLAGQIRLPCSGCGSVPGFDTRMSIQQVPSIGLLSDGSFAVTYEDGRKSSPGQNNVSMTAVSADAKEPEEDEVYFDTTVGVQKIAGPKVAGGPAGMALAVWIDTSSGALRGRIWSKTGGWMIEPITLASSGASEAGVAGWNGGWKVVWHGFATDPDDIVMMDVSSVGDMLPQRGVNARTSGVQSQPAVAFAPSGESIVVWNESGSIFMQRYDKSGAAITGDQESSVSTDGGAENPAVAGSSLSEGFFAIAWQAQGSIFGRFADLSGGYLFNWIDGQDGAFEVGVPGASSGPRTLPSVAIGGQGFVAFAWQDDSQNHPGIYARRFPLPAR
ncbi:MAG TPA: hypothetical protein PLI95_10635 [Polyangiaceae bacterium]|nr:hypothetical protein [Polyangiaceae bacterium]